ncbi:MAG: MtaA/CmuA family methyltransferase [Candidatus Methanomethylophilaceae archaeon]|nr:MtaA/CmuA family methyltransferase [Candidatus Methanomethylophilaceae archaeon]MDD4119242.1 MtaA/CmuA family methyltransferase [Candidatus Methanomethylophilaceae archaeon]MDD4453973.1 MtaA/CmuA family methyltransferase [Candidatus Methanomethylophilaceae archaeon]
MEKLSCKERFERAMRFQEVDRPPVCGMTTAATTELMDYTGAPWPEVHTDAKLMAKLGLGAYPFLKLESIRIPYCLSYEAEVLGAKVNLGKKNSTPMVKGSKYRDNLDADLELMDEKEMLKAGRNPVIIEASKIIMKDKASKDLPTVLGVTGPFTIAGHLVGTENLILWTITEEDMAHKYSNFVSEYVGMWLEYVDRDMGFDTIQMSEPSASWDMLSPELFDAFALPNLKKVYKRMDNTMSILHICGNMLPMLDNMINTGCTGCSIEEKTDPYQAVKKANKRAALIGNVGVVKPLLQGTPEDVRVMTEKSIDAGFNVISAGCGLSALIKKENLRMMADTTVNHGKKK